MKFTRKSLDQNEPTSMRGKSWLVTCCCAAVRRLLPLDFAETAPWSETSHGELSERSAEISKCWATCQAVTGLVWKRPYIIWYIYMYIMKPLLLHLVDSGVLYIDPLSKSWKVWWRICFQAHSRHPTIHGWLQSTRGNLWLKRFRNGAFEIIKSNPSVSWISADHFRFLIPMPGHWTRIDALCRGFSFVFHKVCFATCRCLAVPCWWFICLVI
jgi:hypothetical protein